MSKVQNDWDKESKRHESNNRKVSYLVHPYQLFVRFRLYSEIWKDIKHADSALEIGAGAGYNLEYLLNKHKISSAVALDMSPKMLNLAKDRLAKLPVRFINEDFLSFTSNQKYSLIISVQSINYFRESSKFLQKCSNFLTVGGQLIIIDAQKPYDSPLNHLKKNKLLRRILNKHEIISVPSELTYHSIKNILDIAKENDLEILKIKYFGHFIQKWTSPFQKYAEGHVFESEVFKKLSLLLLRIIFYMSWIEMKIFGDVNINSPLYAIILKKV